MDVVPYRDRRGHEPMTDYLKELDRSGQSRVLAALEDLIDRFAEEGPYLGSPTTRLIDRGERIFELRAGAHRFSFILHADVIVMLHGWRKTSQKLDRLEAARAARLASDWRARH